VGLLVKRFQLLMLKVDRCLIALTMPTGENLNILLKQWITWPYNGCSSAHSTALYSMLMVSERLFVSGDEHGEIKVRLSTVFTRSKNYSMFRFGTLVHGMQFQQSKKAVTLYQAWLLIVTRKLC